MRSARQGGTGKSESEVFMISNKEIIRLKEGGSSYREIGAILHCSQSTVSKTLKAAKEKGLTSAKLADMDDKTVCQLLFGLQERSSEHHIPDFAEIDEKLKTKGVNLALAWDEYIRMCEYSNLKGYQYSQFAKLYGDWRKVHGRPADLTRRIKHKPGRLTEVDWCGLRSEYIEFTSGAIINPYVFVACLPFSQRLYVEAFDDMSQHSWITAHINTFVYNKGVSVLVTPDNCKTAVQTPDYYDPLINKDYGQLAAHYGCSILPARPARPKDKASGENSVKFVETWIIAYLRDERFFSLGELNAAINKRVEHLNAQPFQGFDYSRDDVFFKEELSCLQPLPPEPFELCEWRRSKVNIDYCIQVERQRYSVPYRLVGEYVDVRIGSRTLEIFKDGERICSHPRLFGRFNQSAISEEHMPDAHRLASEEWNPERLKKWAASIGPSCLGVIESILASKPHPALTYRSCLGVLGTARTVGNASLEDLCKTALATSSAPSYKQIKMLAKKGADVKDGPSTPTQSSSKSIGDSGMTRTPDNFRLDFNL
jgi:transposase